MRPKLVIFAKRPVAGEVKTRLGAAIGNRQAAAFYADELAAMVDRVASEQSWDVALAVTPDCTLDEALWPKGVRRAPQGEGCLGERLARVLALASPGSPVAVVGSDIPDLGPEHIREAFTRLRRRDLVFGPCPDGGYWLIAASAPPPTTLFDNVRWSTPYALTDTLGNAGGLKIAIAATLEDVDDEPGYRRYVERRGAKETSSEGHSS